MKSTFKPLGVAVAVAAATVGYVNVANAQPAAADPVVANNNLGDLGLVPYYTVKENWNTGIHIVNTSDRTQVVKFRFRRSLDSLDALDFNVVLSPEDVYAGSLRKDESDPGPNGETVFWSANDSTCTSPSSGVGVKLYMPNIYNVDGAGETGYVEIIGMGSPIDALPSEINAAGLAPLSAAALHDGGSSSEVGVPVDCDAVDRTFIADGTSADLPGVVDGDTAWTPATPTVPGSGGANFFEDTGNVLKVSYFLRNRDTGVEMGDNAVHIQNFLTVSSITNQEFGWLSGDLNGFDFPNLNGTAPVNAVPGGDETVQIDRFQLLRDPSVLGVDSLVNEWAANDPNNNTWVVTLPGQYTMFDTPQYVVAATDPTVTCTRTNGCDNRDIPITVRVEAYDREEFPDETPDDSGTVVSPSIPGDQIRTTLDKEVNVITFGLEEDDLGVFGVKDRNIDARVPQPFGWAALAVEQDPSLQYRICDWVGLNGNGDIAAGPRLENSELLTLQDCSTGDSATGAVPMIGFAAWTRQPAGAPAGATYGRIVEHSFTSAASAPTP